MEVKMAQKKVYDKEFKVQAVKLGREIGFSKEAKEGRLDLGLGTHTPETATSLIEEVQKLRQQNHSLKKENARLKEENEFLAEASTFFAASRWKSPKV